MGDFKFNLNSFKSSKPIFIGFVLAWLFNPIVVKLENRGWKRGIACVTVYLAFIIILFAFFGMLIPTLYNQLNDLVAALPNIFNQVKLWITNF